jgi:hypothetical protein
MALMTGSREESTTVRGSRVRVIAWIVLLAFTVQSFITQTHIHVLFGRGDAASVKMLASGSPHGKTSKQDGSADCPFCQAITHAGTFATPSPPNLVLPVRLADIGAPLFLAGDIGIAPSLPWQSRAPPLRIRVNPSSGREAP